MAYADSTSDLPLLECVGFPVAVNPEARLATVARRRGWHVEHWDKAGGGGRPCCPSGPSTTACRAGGRGSRAWSTTSRRPGSASAGGPVKALVVERSLPRFAAARLRLVARRFGDGRGRRPAAAHRRRRPGRCPAPAGTGCGRCWPGICGSDLATLDGRSSRYFEDIVSFPFVPGHEVVGVVEETGPDATAAPSLAPGTRVVVEPVLGCVPRGIDPPCPACAEGRVGGCERVAFGHLAPGCRSVSAPTPAAAGRHAGLVAHGVQLHPVPDALSDDDAVMIEPTACAVHAALAAGVEPGDTVAVLGGGTVGLTTTAALRQLATPGALLVGAKLRPPTRSWPASSAPTWPSRPTS